MIHTVILLTFAPSSWKLIGLHVLMLGDACTGGATGDPAGELSGILGITQLTDVKYISSLKKNSCQVPI